MQGLLLAVCMLALALANAGTLAESIPSALVTVSGLEQHELRLRLDIEEASPPCGSDANVKLNGQSLVRDEGVASGQISLNSDQSNPIVANWSLTCVEGDGHYQEQFLNITVGPIDGSTQLNVGFTRRFQPSSQVGISDIEGPTSATRLQNQPDLDLISNSHGNHESSLRRNTDFRYEIAQLDYLRAQLVDFKQRILAKEHQLPENFGWEGDKVFKECPSIRCVLQTAYDQARNAAKNLYSGILRESHMKHHRTQNHRPQNHRHGCQEHDNAVRPHLPLQNSLSFCKLSPTSPPYNGLAKHHPTALQGLLHDHPSDPPRGPPCDPLYGRPPPDRPKEPPKELQLPKKFPDIEDEESFSNRHAEDKPCCSEERDPLSPTKDGGDRPVLPPDDSEGDKYHTPLPPPPHHHHDGKEESPPDRQPGHSPDPEHKAHPPLPSISVLFTDPSVTAYKISATLIILAILLVVLHSRCCAHRPVQVSRRHRRRAALFSVWHSACQNSSLPQRIMFWRRSAGSVSNSEERVDGILARIGNNSDARSDNISTTMEQEIAELRTAASIVEDMVAAEEGRAQTRC